MRPTSLLLLSLALLGNPLTGLPLLGAPAHASDILAPSGRFNVGVKSLKEIKFVTTLRQQYDFSCGSAALATLLNHHYNRPATEAAVFERMFLNGDQQKIRREGFSLLDMKNLLAMVGMKADGFRLPLSKLVEAKVPAIVLISTNGYHHFVVIKGVKDGRVLLGDPATGTHAVARDDFEKMWSNKLLFVIHGYTGPVRFNDPADWQAAPAIPWSEGISRRGLDMVTLPKLGAGDF